MVLPVPGSPSIRNSRSGQAAAQNGVQPRHAGGQEAGGIAVLVLHKEGFPVVLILLNETLHDKYYTFAPGLVVLLGS